MHGKVVIIYSEAKYTKLIVQLIHFLAIQMQKWEVLLPELPQKAIKPAVELPAKVINVKEKNIAVLLLESVSMTVNVVSPVELNSIGTFRKMQEVATKINYG